MYISQLRAEVSSLTNENSHLCRQLDVARSECTVVRGGLEEQLEVQTTAAKSLRGRVAELEGVQDKWDAEQERVKVGSESPHASLSLSHSLSIMYFPPSLPLYSPSLLLSLSLLVSLPPTLSPSLLLSLPPTLSHSHSLSLPLSLSHSHSPSLPPTLSHSHSPSLPLTPSHIPTLPPSHSPSLPFSLPLSLPQYPNTTGATAQAEKTEARHAFRRNATVETSTQ